MVIGLLLNNSMFEIQLPLKHEVQCWVKEACDQVPSLLGLDTRHALAADNTQLLAATRFHANKSMINDEDD